MIKPHILLVTLDSLRADHVGCYGGAPTPFLDAFAATGARFTQHLTSVSATLASHTCLLTGCTPKINGITWNGRAIPRRRHTLPEIAAASGYATSAITSWEGFQMQKVYGFENAYSHGGAAALENRGDQTVQRVVDWLDQADPDQPQLLWVHLIDPHAPDISPSPYPATYQGSVDFTDAVVKELVTAWDRRFGADASIAVITADHGEHLNEHGIVRGHGTLWEVCLHVPLLIRFPGTISPGVCVPELTRQMDVMPTLLDYAALPMPYDVEGMSMRGLIEGRDVDLDLIHQGQAIYDQVYTTTIRTAQYSLHIGEGRNLAGLYDRRIDRGETHNLAVGLAVTAHHSADHSQRDAAQS